MWINRLYRKPESEELKKGAELDAYPEDFVLTVQQVQTKSLQRFVISSKSADYANSIQWGILEAVWELRSAA